MKPPSGSGNKCWNCAARSAIGRIKSRIRIPLVADIHFDYLLALEAIAQGADKIRINPGNILYRDGMNGVRPANSSSPTGGAPSAPSWPW